MTIPAFTLPTGHILPATLVDACHEIYRLGKHIYLDETTLNRNQDAYLARHYQHKELLTHLVDEFRHLYLTADDLRTIVTTFTGPGSYPNHRLEPSTGTIVLAINQVGYLAHQFYRHVNAGMDPDLIWAALAIYPHPTRVNLTFWYRTDHTPTPEVADPASAAA